MFHSSHDNTVVTSYNPRPQPDQTQRVLKLLHSFEEFHDDVVRLAEQCFQQFHPGGLLLIEHLQITNIVLTNN